MSLNNAEINEVNVMDNIALALCGGGGKGAFQIGAWKALEEYGIMQNVKAIAGSSVGALNAVLFALGDYKSAQKIWYKINNADILSPKTSNSNSICSNEPLKNIIKQVCLERIKDCGIEIYVTVCDTNEGLKYEYLNKLNVDEIINVLLAASAMPKIYDPVMRKNRKYIDGGLTEYGNTPISPLYEKGFRNIYVLSLDKYFKIDNIHNGYEIKGINAYKTFPDCNFIPIKPLINLGGLFNGTLNFDQSTIKQRMVIGYSDASQQLSGKPKIYDEDGINKEINNKMTSMFKSAEGAEELEKFIKFMEVYKISAPNIRTHTKGGKFFWIDVWESKKFGWKVQQHDIRLLRKIHLMNFHYRILNNINVRPAYVLGSAKLLLALIYYENRIKFDDS